MSVVEIELALVEDPPHTLRHVDKSTPKYASLLDSIKRRGFDPSHPIELYKTDAGTYCVGRHGMHRFYAAVEARLKTIWAVVLDKPLTDSELIAGQVLDEATHVEARPAEFGRAIIKFMDLPENRGKTKVEIAIAAGREVSFLDKVLKLATLPEDVQELVDDNTIKMGNGLVLVALARAGVPLSKDILDKARIESVPSFQKVAEVEIQRLRAGTRGKKEAPARLRKVEDVRAELKRATLDPSSTSGYVQGLAFALRMDPVSAAAEGLAPAATGAPEEGASLRAEGAKLRAALEAADAVAAARDAQVKGLEREVERLNREIDQKDSVIKALEKGRKPEA